jgi:hypothetical protein
VILFLVSEMLNWSELGSLTSNGNSLQKKWKATKSKILVYSQLLWIAVVESLDILYQAHKIHHRITTMIINLVET